MDDDVSLQYFQLPKRSTVEQRSRRKSLRKHMYQVRYTLSYNNGTKYDCIIASIKSFIIYNFIRQHNIRPTLIRSLIINNTEPCGTAVSKYQVERH